MVTENGLAFITGQVLGVIPLITAVCSEGGNVGPCEYLAALETLFF